MVELILAATMPKNLASPGKTFVRFVHARYGNHIGELRFTQRNRAEQSQIGVILARRVTKVSEERFERHNVVAFDAG